MRIEYHIDRFRHRSDIVHFTTTERYSGIKNDSNLNKEMFEDMEKYIHKTSDSTWRPSRWIDKVVYFERPWIKKLRQLKAGQYSEVFSRKNLPQYHLDKVTGGEYKIDEYVDHHLSHVVRPTSPVRILKVCVVVIDAHWRVRHYIHMVCKRN